MRGLTLAGQGPAHAVPDALVALSDIASLRRYTLGATATPLVRIAEPKWSMATRANTSCWQKRWHFHPKQGE